MISPERLDALQTGWARLLAGYGVAPADAYRIFDRLVTAYTDPHRHYHTLEHIAEMLKVVGRLSRFASDPGAVQLAVWFHDMVYDPTRRDNEEESAGSAKLFLPPEVPEPTVQRIHDMILATDHRSDSPTRDTDTVILLDADLAILGASEERYRRYATDVRKEYAWVSDADWRSGRILTLERFLARPRIYHTDVMFTEAEAAARRNLRAEIDRLLGR
jgi:predicted metal-dependent HD superfamily phosphohydrolase